MNEMLSARHCVWAVLLVVLTGCASGDKLKPVAAQPLVKAVGQRSLAVTEVQAGADIELGLEQELVVRLATSGKGDREWSLVDLAPGVLTATGPRFQRDLVGTTAGDAAGQSIWRLRPSATGSVNVRFEYRRPRSTEPATAVVTYAVTVR